MSIQQYRYWGSGQTHIKHGSIEAVLASKGYKTKY